MAFCAYCGTQVAAVSYAACATCGNSTNGAPRPQVPAGGSNVATIAIIVIVIGVFFVAIAGILAAIAVPNFLTAMQRAKQKRTMADMRALAIAVEAYATDHNVYPRAEDLTSLQSVLTPTYVKAMPKTDAWDHPLRYQCWPEPQCQTYSVGSAGKDGRWEHESLQDYDARSGGATTKFDCDIVFTNGSFVQYPEGVQVK